MDCDVIIVGGGVVGLWSAYHLADQGIKTILFEQFRYPHTRGSSHGQSRCTRTSYAAEEFSAFMPEANRRWKELGKQTGRQLFLDMGLVSFYNIKEKKKDFDSMLQNLRKYQIKHDVIPGEKIGDHFPGLTSDSDNMALYEAEAGLLRADNCLLALQEWYKSHGGDLHDGEPVLSLNPINESRIEVKTSVKTYVCKSVVLTCGAYINTILSTVNLKLPVQPVRAAVYYWQDKSGYKYSLSNNFPSVVVYRNQPTHMYSLPSYEYPGLVKICYHGGPVVDPYHRDALTPEMEAEDVKLLAWLKRQIKPLFPDIDVTSPAITEVCMYTESPDNKDILDFHPKHKNIVFGTGFSGMGFKTSPSVGRILAAMATGQPSPYSLKPFSLKRFTTVSKL